MELAERLTAWPAFPMLAEPPSRSLVEVRIDLDLGQAAQREADLGEAISSPASIR